MVEIADLPGLWHRSLIKWPDGARDTSTWVAWLQGPSLFIDLRMPAGRPSFGGVRGLRDLTHKHVAWLASQEGFAGRLVRDGEFFVWHRELDFQPPAAVPDSGRLRFEGDMMVEQGRYVAYVEHWHLAPGARAPLSAMRLSDRAGGCDGWLVRAGAVFMYARAGQSGALPVGTSLSQWVAGAGSLGAAQALVDCEISFGHAGDDGWVIERSSLPFREGKRLEPERDEAMSHRLGTADTAPDGAAMTRHWEIVELEGDGAAVGAPAVAGT